MCAIKSPKVAAPANADNPLAILRNPILDGMNPAIRSKQSGMNSLRIDRQTSGLQIARV